MRIDIAVGDGCRPPRVLLPPLLVMFLRDLIGSTPFVSSTTVALLALVSTSRCRKPSKCRPLTSTTFGVMHGDGIRRLRLVDMGVAVRADQRRQCRYGRRRHSLQSRR